MRATALLVLATGALLVPGPMAHAVAPAAPDGLTVAQPQASVTKLTWNRPAGADKYEIQVDDDPAFATPEVNTSTVNAVHVPEMALKPATNYWRVRALSGFDRSDWTNGSSFEPPVVTRPVPSSPVDGTHLQQPDNPPLLSWTPSPGAKSYTVQVASDTDFVGADEFTTQTTSLVVTKALGLGDWFWRVIATKGPGIVSEPSDASAFWIDALATPKITGPKGPVGPDGQETSPDVMDVVLDWEPVPGAVGYEVQVAVNADFTTGSLVEDRTGSFNRVVGTRFSPAISYDNNGYYWRVRAVDPANNASDWARSQIDFNRHYELAPRLVFPADAASNVPDPLYFQWESVTHASEYEIWVGTDAAFSPDTYNSCRVAGTTYTPGLFAINDTDLVSVLPQRINEDCDPKPGVTNYWRVRPLDRPFTKPGGGDLPGIQGLWSPTRSFHYGGLSVTGMSPPDGDTVNVPVLRWNEAPGALTYKVTIKNGAGQVVDQETTYATSYAPKGQLPLTVDKNPYTWSVQAITAEKTGSLIRERSFRISGTIPSTGTPLTPLTPSPSESFTGAPSLTWEPVANAAYYRVEVTTRDPNDPDTIVKLTGGLFDQPVAYPAMTDISSALKRAGTYTWRVVSAHDKMGTPIAGPGPTSTFTITPIAQSSGHRVALGGRAVDSNNTGQTPCTPTTGVCTVPATPVLKWDREPGTAFYMVYVSDEPNFSNLLEPTTSVPATVSTMYTPALDNRDWTYGDNQTTRPYYWFIRPCRAVGQCTPGPVGVFGSAHHQFYKKSPPVTGLHATLTEKTEVSFSWDNYWHDPSSTNPADKWAQTGEPLPQSAMKYRIEVATDSSFSPSAIVDTAEVDQMTYTSTSKIYPNRTYWWRVQAIDSDGNGLTWSLGEQKFVRQSPPIELLSPVGDAHVAGTAALRWKAQPYAKSYTLEIYKNDDPSYSWANRVVNATGLLTPAYTWNKPLAPSATAYRWRVLRIDASGNGGEFSAAGRFFVDPSLPNIVAPGSGAVQAPDGPVLEWEQLEGAASYTVTTTSVGSGSTVVGNTVATAWAAPTKYVTGDYSWTVTAKDATGNNLGSATSTFRVDAALVVDQRPAILSPDGTAVGRQLVVRAPTWQGGHTDVAVTYQWLRDGQTISGTGASSGRGETYVIQAADFGKSITVRATGTKANYATGSSTSDPVTPTAGDALVASTQPSVTGTPAVGSLLTGNRGTWANDPTGYTYEWLRDNQPIVGATSTTYRLAAADAGSTLVFRVHASRAGYATGTADSAPVTVQSLTATSPPQVGAPGGTAVGATLTSTPPVWNQPDVVDSYQWLRNGTPIPGATIATYTVTVMDFGKEISLRVTGKKTGFLDSTSVSNVVSATAGGALQPSIVPVVSGTAAVGSTLQVSSGTWSQPTPTVKYQWLRNGAPIPDATWASYRLTPGDAGTSIAVVVLASKVGFNDGSSTTVAVSIPKMKSTTVAALSATRVPKGKRVKIGITVTVPGVTGPIGTVKIYDGAKALKTLPLVSSRLGKVSWKMTKLKPGKHKIKAVYLGNGTTYGSRSKVVKLIVARG